MNMTSLRSLRTDKVARILPDRLLAPQWAFQQATLRSLSELNLLAP
jgi:hypothetical protein